jgi:bifunctional DNA-binding transcriptional regulator/antitoxin component of YhaV-PrlF toxin-antitoxin module
MPRLLGKSRVWGRGYTTIPVTVRRVLGLCNSDEVEWYMGDNGEVIIRKAGGEKWAKRH